MKAYKIITGEDPDQKESEPLRGKEERTPMASEKQIAFIQKMHDQSPENAAFIENACPDPKKLTMAQASDIIAHLKGKK